MVEALLPETLAWRPALAVIVLRTLPFAAAVAVSPRARWLSKLTATSACLALATFLGFNVDLFWMTGVLVYYLLCSGGVFLLERAFRQGHLSAGAVFTACAFVFVILP